MAVLTHAQLEQLWILAGGSQATADTAAAIAQAESGGDTTRINNTAYPKLPGYHPPAPGNLPEYSVGLWQVNEVAHPSYTTTQLLTQLGNAGAAVTIANGGASFSAWSTFTSGAYKDFLTSAGTPGPQSGPVDITSVVAVTPHAHRGWADLGNSVTRHLPNQLEISRRARERTLRLLVHRHKVRH